MEKPPDQFPSSFYKFKAVFTVKHIIDLLKNVPCTDPLNGVLTLILNQSQKSQGTFMFDKTFSILIDLEIN